jgi:hypothetical protein
MTVLRVILAISFVAIVTSLSVSLDPHPASAASTLCVSGLGETSSPGYNEFSYDFSSGLHYVSSVQFINANDVFATDDSAWTWGENYTGGHSYGAVGFYQSEGDSGDLTGDVWVTYTC